jgi:hypothetical protein
VRYQVELRGHSQALNIAHDGVGGDKQFHPTLPDNNDEIFQRLVRSHTPQSMRLATIQPSNLQKVRKS